MAIEYRLGSMFMVTNRASDTHMWKKRIKHPFGSRYRWRFSGTSPRLSGLKTCLTQHTDYLSFG